MISYLAESSIVKTKQCSYFSENIQFSPVFETNKNIIHFVIWNHVCQSISFTFPRPQLMCLNLLFYFRFSDKPGITSTTPHFTLLLPSPSFVSRFEKPFSPCSDKLSSFRLANVSDRYARPPRVVCKECCQGRLLWWRGSVSLGSQFIPRAAICLLGAIWLQCVTDAVSHQNPCSHSQSMSFDLFCYFLQVTVCREVRGMTRSHLAWCKKNDVVV